MGIDRCLPNPIEKNLIQEGWNSWMKKINAQSIWSVVAFIHDFEGGPI